MGAVSETDVTAASSETDRDAIRDVCDHLGRDAIASIEPVNERSNLNRVFRVTTPAQSYYLKVAQMQPKGAFGTVPRARVFAEAAAMRFARRVCDGLIEVPAVVHENRASYSFLMTDVGSVGVHLSDCVPGDFATVMRAHECLSEAMGRFHRSSAAAHFPITDTYHYESFRDFIYGDLLGPGFERMAIHEGFETLKEMRSVRECLVHSDLWGKNVLAGEQGPPAVFDFEGAILGDPAFDVATLVSSGLISVYQYGVDFKQWRSGAERMLQAYRRGLDDAEWLSMIYRRLPRYVAVFIALRVAGPFPYDLDEACRHTLGELAQALIAGRAGGSWGALCELAEDSARQLNRGLRVDGRLEP